MHGRLERTDRGARTETLSRKQERPWCTDVQSVPTVVHGRKGSRKQERPWYTDVQSVPTVAHGCRQRTASSSRDSQLG